jgi:hypothetical protein
MEHGLVAEEFGGETVSSTAASTSFSGRPGVASGT